MRRYGLSSRKFTSASCFARLSRTPPSPKDAQLAASDPERDPRPSPPPPGSTTRLVRPVQRPTPRLPASSPQARRRALARSPAGPPAPPHPPAGPLPPRCPLSPPGRGRARPGRRAGAGPRAAPAPPGNPPSPAAGEGRRSASGGEGAGEKVDEALLSGCRQGSPLPAPIQTKEAPSPARRPRHPRAPAPPPDSLRRAPMRRLPSLISSLMNLFVLSSSIS